jgi:hypothetical protein
MATLHKNIPDLKQNILFWSGRDIRVAAMFFSAFYGHRVHAEQKPPCFWRGYLNDARMRILGIGKKA